MQCSLSRELSVGQAARSNCHTPRRCLAPYGEGEGEAAGELGEVASVGEFSRREDGGRVKEFKESLAGAAVAVGAGEEATLGGEAGGGEGATLKAGVFFAAGLEAGAGRAAADLRAFARSVAVAAAVVAPLASVNRPCTILPDWLLTIL